MNRRESDARNVSLPRGLNFTATDRPHRADKFAMTHDDEGQLRILSRLHYVGAALASVMPLSGALYGALGVAILLGKLPGSAAGPGRAIGWLPLATGLFVVAVGVTAVALNLVCARAIQDRKRHTLCLLTAALNCVHFPLGTLLGTFTLIVLCREGRPAVRTAFDPLRGTAEVPPPSHAVCRPGGTHYLTLSRKRGEREDAESC